MPLEFISSIYETFVAKKASKEGIFYTPPHLVDFVLDRVLPWDGEGWNLTILDPACGSGIFLVKAFQRLVHRWKRAHPDQPVRAEILRRLLERNLFGVDKDPHAIRVACFSLYLAMCDEIEPRQYWSQIVFPAMRNRRLICSDFFAEDCAGFRTDDKSDRYDLVIGNAPWGEDTGTDAACKWAAESGAWSVVNNDIGGLFLPKSAKLLHPNGRIAMIQSANALLFNATGKARKFRHTLFASYHVEEIINFSVLRNKIFNRKSHTSKSSIAPFCILVMRGEKPAAGDHIQYSCPKQVEQIGDEFSIVIEARDRHLLSVQEAISDPIIWTILIWGSARDRRLLARLHGYPSLEKYKLEGTVKTCRGISFGNKAKKQEQLQGRRMFKCKQFPNDSFVTINADDLPESLEVWTDYKASTDFSAFALPQLIIKQSWQKQPSRFQARLVKSTQQQGILCNRSYITVNAPPALLETAFLSFNSLVAVYFLLLTSSRFATYRPEPKVEELLTVPIPSQSENMLDSLDSPRDIDQRVFKAFELKDAEQVLIEDLFDYTLADFRGNDQSAGRQATAREQDGLSEPQLDAYSRYFIRVLKAGFGRDKAIKATIFQGESGAPLPFRLIAFQLGRIDGEEIEIQRIKTAALIREFERLNSVQKKSSSSCGGIYHERLARIYDSSSGTPSIFIFKPNLARYWTRSAGLCDADEVAADLFRWQQSVAKGTME